MALHSHQGWRRGIGNSGVAGTSVGDAADLREQDPPSHDDQHDVRQTRHQGPEYNRCHESPREREPRCKPGLAAFL